MLAGAGDEEFRRPADRHRPCHGPPGVSISVTLRAGSDLIIGNSLTQDASILLNTSAAPSTADPIATNITLAADLNSTVFGQRVTLTATVTALWGTPTGTVSFFDGDRPLGEVAVDPNGQAALVLPLGVGVHS